MKRSIIYRLSIVLTAILAFQACQDEALETFDLESNSPGSVSSAAGFGEPRKDGERLVMPLTVRLSAAAAKAFQVEIQLNPDTVAQLVAGGQLEGVVPVPVEQLTVPTTVLIPFGADSGVFEVAINLGFLERNYGKQVAFAYRLVNPGKGNTLEGDGAVITLNTETVLQPDEIRYLSLTNGGGTVLEARNRQNYQVQSGGLNVPLGISLAGVPGRAFTVEAKINPDTIASLVEAGILPENTIPLDMTQVTMDTVRRIGSNISSAPLDVFVQWSVIEQHMDKLLAVAVTLTNPSNHVLDEQKKSAIILIYPEHVLEVDVTGEATYSVSRDNGDGPEGGEGSLKLVDNDTGSKFLVGDYRADLWVQLVYDAPTKLGAYTLTSANDAPDRDPKDWELLGSNDGENWVTLDARTGEVFTERFQTKRYEFNTAELYTHYRIQFGVNNGSNLWQLGEWRVIRVP
ncbi:discoidin domain-containing protein [Parapedobacter sp. DT-150]|uniref:discoidin domain-containing protein n=1 Tax=Parapedobacter sp. DT-150 TaxID=3396162 RepID=UPI003F1C5636